MPAKKKLTLKLQMCFSVVHFPFYPTSRKMTHAVAATNNSFTKVPSIINRTDLLKAVVKLDKYPPQSSQKKKDHC